MLADLAPTVYNFLKIFLLISELLLEANENVVERIKVRFIRRRVILKI